jgi:hypothetical protein
MFDKKFQTSPLRICNYKSLSQRNSGPQTSPVPLVVPAKSNITAFVTNSTLEVSRVENFDLYKNYSI